MRKMSGKQNQGKNNPKLSQNQTKIIHKTNNRSQNTGAVFYTHLRFVKYKN